MMSKQNPGWGTIVAAVTLLVFICAGCKNPNRPDGSNVLENIREQNKTGFDSLQRAFDQEDKLNDRIKRHIDSAEFDAATVLMDSLPSYGKEATLHFYKGLICSRQGRYPEAIEEYTLAIRNETYPIALDQRAQAYIKSNELKLALRDHTEAYNLNYDYSFQLASTFELMKKADSATKYYKISLNHYPDDTVAQRRLHLQPAR